MGFIKTGDGKIINVLEEGQLTEKQKKAVKDMSNEMIKQSSSSSDKENVRQ